MALRIVLFGLIGLVVTMLGVIGFTVLRPAPAPVQARIEAPAPRPLAKILVAARSLNVGTLLKPDDIAVAEVETDTLTPDLLPDTELSRAELRGALVRRPIDNREKLTASLVLRPRDRGFLAAVLQPGSRAITVGVDAVSGTAGLIWPGDRVDLILTQSIDEQTVPLGKRVVGETVLTDVRVIAVDQALAQGADSATIGGEPRSARTVTLETSPNEAERVAVATRLGRLALSVRSIDEQAAPASSEPGRAASTFGSDVSPALSAGPAGRPTPPTIRLHLGAKTEEVILR